MTGVTLTTLYFLGLTIVQIQDGPSYWPLFLITIMAILYLCLKKKITLIDKETAKPQIYIIMAALISLVWNFNFKGLAYIIGFIINIIIYNNLFKEISLSQFRILFFILFLSVLYPRYDAGKWCSIYGNSITVGLIITFLTYLLFLLWKNKLFIFFMLTVFAYILYLSGNRSGILTIFIFIFLYFSNLKFGPKFATFISLCLLVSIISYLTLMVLTKNNLLMKPINIKFYGKNILDASSRDNLIRISMPIIKNNFFGIGLGDSPSAIKNFTKMSSPHNTYIKIAMEGGWLMLIAYIILLLKMYTKSEYPITRSMLVAYGIRVLFEIATPFGFSLVSALLIAPYFIEKGLKNIQ